MVEALDASGGCFMCTHISSKSNDICEPHHHHTHIHTYIEDVSPHMISSAGTIMTSLTLPPDISLVVTVDYVKYYITPVRSITASN